MLAGRESSSSIIKNDKTLCQIRIFENGGILEECGSVSTATLLYSHRSSAIQKEKDLAAQNEKKLNGLVVEGCLDKQS